MFKLGIGLGVGDGSIVGVGFSVGTGVADGFLVAVSEIVSATACDGVTALSAEGRVQELKVVKIVRRIIMGRIDFILFSCLHP
jgi:hypothetical protein